MTPPTVTPPPVILADEPTPGSEFRPGQLSIAWQIMLSVVWTAAFFAFSMVWKASVEIGIATWWLGPRSAEQPIVIRIIPFALAIVIGLLAIYNVPRVALLSCTGALGVAVIASFDIDRSGGLAAIEFAIAALTLIASIGALAGTARRAPAVVPAD